MEVATDYDDYYYDVDPRHEEEQQTESSENEVESSTSDNVTNVSTDNEEQTSSTENGEEEEEEEDADNYYDYDYDYDYEHPWYDTDNEDEEQNSDSDSSDSNSSDDNIETTEDNEQEEEEEEEEQYYRPRRVKPKGVQTSQCSFQPEPASISDEALSSFIAHARPYLEEERRNVRSGNASSETRDEMLRCAYHYAEYFGCVSGNWLSFIHPTSTGAVWSAVSEANEEGRLAGYVELRTNRGYECVIAAHVPDYRDTEVAERVMRTLQSLGANVTTFKPTLLTSLGVYRNSQDNSNYSYAELGLPSSPVPPEIEPFLPQRYKAALPRRNRKKQRTRRPGGGGGGGGGGGHGRYYYSNRYYHGRRHSPSLPNGKWSSQEESQQWIYHVGRPAQEYGRGGGYESYANAQGRGILDAYVSRLYSGEHITRAEKRSLMWSLWELGDRYDVVTGKWTIFAPSSVADGVWTAICDANDAGQLGGSLKCGTYNEISNGYAIFVYCNDFTNTEDCSRILNVLKHTCAPYGVGVIANFKPDFFTQLGIYGSELRGTSVEYPLNRLRLKKYWPHPVLKQILDEVKRGY